MLGRINNGTDDDIAVIKYNNEDMEQWTAIYASVGDGDEHVFDFAVDLSGNVYVIGFTNDGTSWDYFIVKFNAEGAQEWVIFPDYNLRAIEVDSAGFFYVAGIYWPVSNDDYLTAKYRSDGIEVWAKTYVSGVEPYNSPLGMFVDQAGNVCVTGITHDGFESPEPDLNADFGTVKYDTDGSVLWTATYSSPGDNNVWILV